MGAVKTKRFLSRMMAEINEVKVGQLTWCTLLLTRQADERHGLERGARRGARAAVWRVRVQERGHGQRDQGQGQGPFHVLFSALLSFLKPFQEAELLRDHCKNIYKAHQASMVALAAYRESVKVAQKSLQDFHDVLEDGRDTDLLKASLSTLIQTTEATATSLQHLSDAEDRHVVQPIIGFVKKDVRDARYFTHEVLKVRKTLFSVSLPRPLSGRSSSTTKGPSAR